MSDSEFETFNVKNTSLRLVHIGGVSVPPEKVVALVNDPKGINKADVESSEYLEETDEDINWPEGEKKTETVIPKAKPDKVAAKSATGASWSKQP